MKKLKNMREKLPIILETIAATILFGMCCTVTSILNSILGLTFFSLSLITINLLRLKKLFLLSSISFLVLSILQLMLLIFYILVFDELYKNLDSISNFERHLGLNIFIFLFAILSSIVLLKIFVSILLVKSAYKKDRH